MNFNDLLAIILVVLIVVLWVLDAMKKISLAGEVKGALISAFMLIVQYYFRKKPPSKGGRQ